MKKVIIIILLTICSCTNQKIQVIDTVSFIGLGDNILHERLLEEAKSNKEYHFDNYYEYIKKDIQKADLSYINQETIVGGDQIPASGYPLFNTPSSIVDTFCNLGIDIVNGATNHSADQGEEGILNSIQIFKKYPDIQYIGLNATQEDRDTVTIIKSHNIRFALLSYTQLTNQSIKHQFMLNRFDKESIKKDIENAKEISDVIIVSCHWGKEYSLEPSQFQKEYAEFFNEEGVDLVIGTHPHVIQPVEIKKNKEGHQCVIAYSLGNSLSGMLEKEAQVEGMLSLNFVKVNRDVEIQDVKIIPLINHYEANPKNINETRKNFRIYKLENYSKKLVEQHGINGYNGQILSLEWINKFLQQQCRIIEK